MPNHVRTIVVCPESHQATILDVCGTLRDFNACVPMPPDVAQQAQHDAMQAAQGTRLDPTDILPDVLYDWRLEHWGTKWEGYRYKEIEGGIMFETAWAHPLPILQAVSRAFPSVPMFVRYADEDTGYNIGTYRIHAGEITCDTTVPNEGTKAAHQFACEVWREDFDTWVAEFVSECGSVPWKH